MITKFNCTCGNTNPRKAHEYEGFLGYVALVCKVCGRYSDEFGMHEKDSWSIDYIERKPII